MLPQLVLLSLLASASSTNVTGIFDFLPTSRVVVNSTQLGNAVGVALAGTFFTAAAVTNFPGLLDFVKGSTDALAQERSEDAEEQQTCDCEMLCRQELQYRRYKRQMSQ